MYLIVINYTRGNITVASALPNITDKRRMLPPLSGERYAIYPTCFVNRKSMGKSEKISLVMQMQPRYLKYLTETGRINIVFGEIKLDMYQEVGGGFVAELN